MVLSDTRKDCYNMTLLLTPIQHVTLYIFMDRLCEYVSESRFFSFHSVRALDQSALANWLEEKKSSPLKQSPNGRDQNRD